MNEHELENSALHFLQKSGFSAEFIKEGSSLTPDISARDLQGVSYLLEIKHRTVAWQDRAEVVEQVSPEGIEVMVRVDHGESSNSVSSKLKKAARQLESVASSSKDVLRIVWIFANHTDRDYHYELVRQNAYGIRWVVAMGSPVREGMYVAPAAFARWRGSIDGILLGMFEGIFINDLSPRYETLKSSRVAQLCGEAVLDPVELAATGFCYHLTPDETSPTAENIKARLETKYGIQIIKVIDMQRYSAATIVPDRT